MDSTKRFSDRVDYYVRYRPTYPPAVMEFLRDRLGLRPESVVADIGSGTGISTRMFLDNGASTGMGRESILHAVSSARQGHPSSARLWTCAKRRQRG